MVTQSFWLLMLLICLASGALGQRTITLSKRIGPPTTNFLVSGSGFAPNTGVDIYFDTKDETLVITDSNGGFQNAAAQALPTSHPGKHWVTALERNDGQGTQQPFVVFTNWSQFQYDGRHDGVNPYENFLNKDNVSRLKVAWAKPDLNPFSSPAVVNGLAYLNGASLGNAYIFALNAISGDVVWKYSTYDSSRSMPAVANGVVFDQEIGGLVYAVDAKTGALIWRQPTFLNPADSSPVYANGVLYVAGNVNNQATLVAMDPATGNTVWSTALGPFDENATAPTVGSDAVYLVADQTVYAVNANSGRELWTYSLGAVQGYNPGAPSFSNGVVFVGWLDDNIYALDAITGELIWKYATKGSISSSPAVANGLVYVGSTDHYVYALNANTGALVWKYLTPSEVHSSFVLANGVAFCSSSDNFLYAWDALTGALLWKYGFGYGNSFPPAVANGTVWISEVTTVYAFTPSPSDSSQDSASDVPPAMRTLHPDLSLGPRK